MARKRSPIGREGLPKAAAAAAGAGAALAAGKVARDRIVAGRRLPRGYQLKDGEAVPAGVERIALGRLDDAIDELRGKTKSSEEEAVHEARKDLKKLRALLRLARDEIGDDVYRRENDCFGDAARRLSGVRDADVMIETLDALAERYPRRVPPEAAGGLRQALEAHRRALAADGAGRERAVGEVIDVLRQARERVPEWPLRHDGFEALEGGLRRIYRRGRRAYRAALEEPSVENLHEWRKRVKDLWYHHSLLECSWPELMEPLGDQAHALSDHLGEDHDLAVLNDWAQTHVADVGGPERLQSLDAAVARRRAKLQEQAFALGARLYGERPRDFVRRLETYWDAWRAAPNPGRTLHTAR